MLNIWKL